MHVIGHQAFLDTSRSVSRSDLEIGNWAAIQGPRQSDASTYCIKIKKNVLVDKL